MERERALSLVLRIGLAFAFLYPPVSAYFNPLAWIGYFPPFLLDAAGENGVVLLHVFGAIEIVIALWLLWGRYIFYPSVAAAVLLLGIVLFNTNQMDVLFRDLSILAIAVALAYLSYPREILKRSTASHRY